MPGAGDDVAFTLGAGIAVGALTRPAAVGLALLGVLGMLYFGPLLVLEHVYFFGIAICLCIAGRGPGATERVLRGPGKPLVRLLPYAIPALRVSFGLATVITGFTEKLWDRGLGLDFLAAHPFNVTAATPFPRTDAQFVIGAGLAEASLGTLLVTGLFPRLAVLAAWVPFNLTVPFLGAADVLGHLPIYGILLTILLGGNGGGFAATLRRETEPRVGAPAPQPPPPLVRPRELVPGRGVGDQRRAGRAPASPSAWTNWPWASRWACSMSRSARPLAYIALQACALTFIGLALGTRLGARLEASAELIAGMVLALLGLALIVSEASGRHFL